jgi:hypothetical protein
MSEKEKKVEIDHEDIHHRLANMKDGQQTNTAEGFFVDTSNNTNTRIYRRNGEYWSVLIQWQIHD